MVLVSKIHEYIKGEKMNIYKKIITISKNFLEAKVKKSGNNKYAGFKYFTLDDLEPVLINLMDEYNLYIEFNFNESSASATIINIDNPEETRVITSPMPKLDLKGANSIQEMGGQQTYMRRYFLLNIFHICEPDLFDATIGKYDEEIKLQIKSKLKKIVENGKTTKNEILEKFPEIKKIESLNMNQLKCLNQKIKTE